VHWMRPGRDDDSMRLAVFIVSPSSVYLAAGGLHFGLAFGLIASAIHIT
jgi:hypothetical protein